MALHTADPLPECLAGCGRPMRRKTWQAQHGVCSSCGPNPVRARLDAAARDRRTPREAR